MNTAVADGDTAASAPGEGRNFYVATTTRTGTGSSEILHETVVAGSGVGNDGCGNAQDSQSMTLDSVDVRLRHRFQRHSEERNKITNIDGRIDSDANDTALIVEQLEQSATTNNNGNYGSISGGIAAEQRQYDQSLSNRHSRKIRRLSRRSRSQVFLPRIVNRDMAFFQSSNRFAVKTLYQRVWLATLSLARHDWFHILLRMHFVTAMLILIFIWTVMILVFAGVYLVVGSRSVGFSDTCLLGALNEETGKRESISFAGAFAFSLETCTTVGYGLPNGTNSFFEKGCSNLQTAIYFQMVWSMLFNAFMFSFLYSQLAKSEKRAIQVVFSDKLCITASAPSGRDPNRNGIRDRRVSAHFLDGHGPITLTVRCYDLDATFPLVECHARMYLLDHRMKLHPLRLQDPNDELGAMLMPSIPTEIVHVIDHHSVLSPTRTMPLVDNESLNSMPMRSIDSVIGSREEIVCPVCGESYGTYERLKRHVMYSALVDEDAGFDVYPASHRGFVMPDIRPIGLEEVKRHIERTLSEIIVVVEAIDPQLSGTFQSLQSYKYDDIQFGANFDRCISVTSNQFAVDMKQFHHIEYDPEWKHLWSDETPDSKQSDNDVASVPSSSNRPLPQQQPGPSRISSNSAKNTSSNLLPNIIEEGDMRLNRINVYDKNTANKSISRGDIETA